MPTIILIFMNDSLIKSDELRLKFSQKLSERFSEEVPAYKTLLKLVSDINQTNDLRINRERHGAIRLGLPSELKFIKRLFAIYGMYPVEYYNLSTAGMPVHSTAFRPIHSESLEFCPFRIFTSLLKTDFITDSNTHKQALHILENRCFIPSNIESFMIKAEQKKGLNEKDADKFIELSLEIFAFNPQSLTDYYTYQSFKNLHPLIADVVCFQNPHINHLTPRTLDIDTAQENMSVYGIPPKAIIEGPPKRNIPILLRQTSFKALPETVYFNCGTETTHTARFGEIEQRGFALSKKGRILYDILIGRVNETITINPNGSNATKYYTVLNEVFSEFPDDMNNLLSQDLLKIDLTTQQPKTYEDFLPVSAAGIFTSNLGYKAATQENDNDYLDFCNALGDTPLLLMDSN